MAFEFKLPDVGEGVAEGTLENWLVEVGDAVTEDMPVAEVETDKALVEVPSPVNGTVKELPWEPGDVVPVGDTFVVFSVEGEDDEADAGAEAEPGPADADADADAEPEAPAGASDGTAEEVDTPEGRVFAAPSTRQLARELGVDLATVEGTGPGGRVTDADVRAAAEDGAEPAPEPDPATAGAEADTDADAGASASAEPAPPAGTEAADRERTLAAPATRRIAEEEGIDIDAVPATEHRDGEAFVTPEAVREYAQAQRAAQEADTEALAKYEAAEPDREERVPYTGVRRAIGDQMARSKYTAPHVTHHDEVDVTALVETREELKAEAEQRGIRLTYMPFVMKACAAALKEFPEVNAALDEENDEIVKKNYYNVGVATATDVGLMVPVVDDVDRKGLLQIASETNELVAKARERSIAREEMQGGTFTVTNVGGIGGEYATPILNYPEAAILALGAIKKKPRVVERDGEDSIEVRHVLTLSLSFDHRVIDGAVGARFTNEVKQYLENPNLLLLE
jgi:pyruvate dehydrogenase E2 component (dihydrolipoamide acetyltransferase)